jgi:hypothetical protein
VNFVKLPGVVLLCTAWLAVLFGLVLPVAVLILGLGIDLPLFWARSGRVFLVYLYPWFSLFIGLGALIVLGWATVHCSELRH